MRHLSVNCMILENPFTNASGCIKTFGVSSEKW